jgi:hypothetical protein
MSRRDLWEKVPPWIQGSAEQPLARSRLEAGTVFLRAHWFWPANDIAQSPWEMIALARTDSAVSPAHASAQRY